MAVVILFHVGLAIMLSINLASDDKPPVPSAKKHNIINAVAVDAKQYDERKKQKELAVKKKRDDAKAAKEKAAKEKAEKKKAAEKIRIKELERKKSVEKKKAAEKKAAKAAAIAKQKEIKLAKKKAEEKKIKEKKAKEEKARKEKARKEKQRLEAEKKRKAEEKRKRIEAEKKRKAEEERKRRAEEKADFEREMREEEDARKAAARAVRLQTQREQYIIQIARKVENNWLRPAANIDGQSCDVIVTQTMKGDVIDVRLQSCTGDTAFQRSVERAVRKAEPLPLAPNPDVYDSKIYFTFKPR